MTTATNDNRINSRSFRYTMFLLLYFMQGISFAYFRNFQKPYLAEYGIDVDTIGILSLAVQLPFVLKIFMGMMSDSVNLFRMGHRKPYMAAGLLLVAACFGGLAFISPESSLGLFGTVVFIGSLGIALFDSTTDGYAIDTTPPEDEGRVQGIMTAGRALGVVVLSLAFGLLGAQVGYRPVFYVIVIATLIPLLLVLNIREPEERHEEQRFSWSAFSDMRRPVFLVFGLYAAVYSIASFGTDGLIPLYISQFFGGGESAIGFYGVTRGLGAVIGGGLALLLVERLGKQKAGYGVAVALSLAIIVLALAPTVDAVIWLGLLWGAVWGFQEAVFFTYAMHIADARIAASMFAIMMAISNLFSALGDGVATALVDDLGYATVLIGLALINVLVIPVLIWFFNVQKKAEAAV